MKESEIVMAKKFLIFPKNPERICWGCDKYCRADDLQCGNGCERIQHPIEVDGQDWYKKGDWSNLLSDQQQIELGLKEAPPAEAVVKIEPKIAKPHIKLPLKNKAV